jgi:long-chain acyl-CoA synthetase
MEEQTVDDEFCFCYTSGTTGDPKGVKLTNKQVCLMTEASIKTDMLMGRDMVTISYLPYPHAME